MQVTINRDDTGRLTAHAAPAAPHDTAGFTVRLCPPDACERWSGTLAHPHQYAYASAELAAVPTQPPRDETVADLNAPTVIVAIHPRCRHTLAVGPFTGPDRARQWWQATPNRFAASGATCHVLPLSEQDRQEGGLR